MPPRQYLPTWKLRVCQTVRCIIATSIITLIDDMILDLKLPTDTSNRYVQYPVLDNKDAIMGLIRKYSSTMPVADMR